MSWPFPIRPPYPAVQSTVVKTASWEPRTCLNHKGVFWVGADRRCFVDGCRGVKTTFLPAAKSGHNMRFTDAR